MSEENTHEEAVHVEEVIDGDVAEETTVVEEPVASTAVAVRPASDTVLMPLDHKQVIEGMKAYQSLLGELLEESDYQEAEQGKKFVKKSGWRKIARAFNLSVTKVSSKVERDHEGNPLRAEVVMRATAPNGQVQDGDGYCSAEEKRFQSAGGKQKLENDLRATATTRAKNRAISDLVGMGEVSAEEVDQSTSTAKLAPASKEKNSTVSTALLWLLPEQEAKTVYEAVAKMFGSDSMPELVADALIVAIAARKTLDEAPDEEPKADNGEEEKS